MIFIKVSPTGLPLEVSTELTGEQHQDKSWQSRWDWKDFATVERLAKYVTAITGETHLPADRTDAVSPRYDIVRAPHVGDKVSYGFNGDYYPDGEIVKVTKTFQVTTSTGKTYRRRGKTSGWCRPGGTWALVHGHIYEQNPHF